jgi:purine-binding chemotaxis protein CheW
MTVETAVARVAQAGKYLSFKLGRQEYGLGILKVQEITGMMGIARVPHAPEFVRGVITLRGRVIPVVCLRRVFGMPAIQDTEKTCVIVAQAKHRDQEVPVGIVVDEVTEVLNIPEAGIEAASGCALGRTQAGCIDGVGKLEDRAVLLLDCDGVLSADDLARVAGVVQ